MGDTEQPCRQEAYRNIDPLIGTIISSGKATLHELKTIYSLEDALNIYEVIAIDYHNRCLAIKEQERKLERR